MSGVGFDARIQRVVAGLLGPLPVRRQEQRLRHVDALIFVVAGIRARTTATPTASAATGAIETHETEDDLLGITDARGQIRRLAAVERQQIEVVAVVHDQRLAILRPARDAVRRTLIRMVIGRVDEVDLVRRAEHRVLTGLGVIRDDLLVLQVQIELAVGRRAHRARDTLLDQRTVTGRRAHAIEIRLAAAPLHFGAIRRVDAAECPARIGQRSDVAHHLVRDANELAARRRRTRPATSTGAPARGESSGPTAPRRPSSARRRRWPSARRSASPLRDRAPAP